MDSVSKAQAVVEEPTGPALRAKLSVGCVDKGPRGTEVSQIPSLSPFHSVPTPHPCTHPQLGAHCLNQICQKVCSTHQLLLI